MWRYSQEINELDGFLYLEEYTQNYISAAFFWIFYGQGVWLRKMRACEGYVFKKERRKGRHGLGSVSYWLRRGFIQYPSKYLCPTSGYCFGFSRIRVIHRVLSPNTDTQEWLVCIHFGGDVVYTVVELVSPSKWKLLSYQLHSTDGQWKSNNFCDISHRHNAKSMVYGGDKVYLKCWIFGLP